MTTNDQYPWSRQFGTVEEAKAYVKEQKMWQYKYTPNSSTGSKLSYLCKFDNKCSGRIQLWMPNDTLDVTTNTIMPQDLYKIFHQIKKNIINIWNNDKRKPNRNLYFQVLPSNYFQVLPPNKILIFDQLESQDNDIYKRGITIRIEVFNLFPALLLLAFHLYVFRDNLNGDYKPNLDLLMMFKKIVQNGNILNDYNFYQQRIQFEVAPISTNAENRMDYLGGKSMSQTTIPTTMMTRKQTSKTQQQQQQQPTDAKPASSSTPQISPKDDQKLPDDETESDTSESETSESIKVPQFNKEDPEVWFIQVEAAIFVGQVRKEKEQYMHVLANLSTEAMTSVRDLVGKQYSTVPGIQATEE
ncbi:hypothetical protein BLOT_016765 [Blomia tropicalis]|nr:hypothetical protein BLOT_016765 [Blomia tropicalis]